MCVCVGGCVGVHSQTASSRGTGPSSCQFKPLPTPTPPKQVCHGAWAPVPAAMPAAACLLAGCVAASAAPWHIPPRPTRKHLRDRICCSQRALTAACVLSSSCPAYAPCCCECPVWCLLAAAAVARLATPLPFQPSACCCFCCTLISRYTIRRRCGSFAWNSLVAAKNTSEASFCRCKAADGTRHTAQDTSVSALQLLTGCSCTSMTVNKRGGVICCCAAPPDSCQNGWDRLGPLSNCLCLTDLGEGLSLVQQIQQLGDDLHRVCHSDGEQESKAGKAGGCAWCVLLVVGVTSPRHPPVSSGACLGWDHGRCGPPAAPHPSRCHRRASTRLHRKGGQTAVQQLITALLVPRQLG